MKLLKNRWLVVLLQTALGVTFVVAAYPKIVDPPNFAHMIYNYKMTPPLVINLVAIYLPWVELIAGVALVVGCLNRGGTALVGLMLVAFVGAIGFNLMRDHAVDCGCFEVVVTEEKTHDELLGEMRLVLWRDIGMLVMVAWIFLAGTVSRPWLPGWQRSDSTTSGAPAPGSQHSSA